MAMAIRRIIHGDQAEPFLHDKQADLIAVGREIPNKPNRPLAAVLKPGIEGPLPEYSGGRVRIGPGGTALIRPKSRCVLRRAGS
jgi:hypothetical protein